MANLTDILKNHFVDLAGGLSASIPIGAVLETKVGSMPYQDSINSKYVWVGLCVVGASSAYSKVRDFTLDRLSITGETWIGKGMKLAHDAAYGAIFSYLASPLNYSLAGVSNDATEKCTWINMAFALPAGIIGGISVDIFRDLMGTKECNYLPRLIKNLDPKIKKSISALLSASAVAATVAYYNYSR